MLEVSIVPTILPEMPPSTPDEIGHNIANAVSTGLEEMTREALQDI